MYPGADGSAALWASQVALLRELRGSGFRYSVGFGDLTASGPSSPNYFQFDDVGRYCAPRGIKICATLSMAVNNHAGWQTLAGDATGWSNYLASGFLSTGHACPPYGSADALVNKVAELQANGINRMRQFYTDEGLDPDEYVFVTLPNERIWDASTVGSGQTYQVCTFVEKMYLKLRELIPTTMIGSTPIGFHYDQRELVAERNAMLAATGQGLNRLPGLSAEFGNATWLRGVDFYAIHPYIDTGAYFSGGAAFHAQELGKKLDDALAVFRHANLASTDKPIWITEFGVSTKFAGTADLGRSASSKYAYLRQGQFLKAAFAEIRKRGFDVITLYSACGDDTSNTRMFGMMVGADANLDGGVDGQWRLTALPLLRARGYQGDTPPADAATTTWIMNIAGTTGTGGDLPGGLS
jgi:hypothetical protein